MLSFIPRAWFVAYPFSVTFAWSYQPFIMPPSMSMERLVWEERRVTRQPISQVLMSYRADYPLAANNWCSINSHYWYFSTSRMARYEVLYSFVLALFSSMFLILFSLLVYLSAYSHQLLAASEHGAAKSFEIKMGVGLRNSGKNYCCESHRLYVYQYA